MQLRNTPEYYGAITKLFHWVIAIGIISMLAVGLIMTDMPKNPERYQLTGWHKAAGIIILGLAVLRVAWRIFNAPPPLPDSMRSIDKIGAQGAHFLLYVLMLAMPLSGWLMSSAAGFPVSVFGWFVLPNLIAPDDAARVFFKEAHEWLAWALIAVTGAHISAALLHHFYYRDTILRRMLPFIRKDNYAPNDTNTGC